MWFQLAGAFRDFARGALFVGCLCTIACARTNTTCQVDQYWDDGLRACVGLGEWMRRNDGAFPDGVAADGSGSDRGAGDASSDSSDTMTTACAAGETRCSRGCTNTSQDPLNCGGCDVQCSAAAGERAVCAQSRCSVECLPGHERIGSECLVRVPRPLYPPGASNVTHRRPVLRWTREEGLDGAVVELCRDRDCSDVIESVSATGTTAQPSAELPASSSVFWRLRGRASGRIGERTSATWQFRTPRLSRSSNVAAGVELDVNGDGFGDLAVTTISSGGFATVEVYLGSPTGLASMPQVSLDQQMLGQFGDRISAAGDVDGDGFGDLLVGACADTAAGGSSGAALLYRGGPSGLSSSPVWRVDGGVGDFACYVAGLTDVNGDGYADIAVGAPHAWPGGVRYAGRTDVYYGGPMGPSTTPSAVLSGTRENERFGSLVVDLGDVNSDSYSDFVITSYETSTGAPAQGGSARVYVGGASRSDIRRIALFDGQSIGERLGSAVAMVGDVNDDGRADFAVGVAGADPSGATDAGRVDIYLGGESGVETVPVRSLVGSRSGAALGSSIAWLRDVSGDGVSDLLIGAPGTSNGSNANVGAAVLYLGVSSGAFVEQFSVLGAGRSNMMGDQVAALGDVDRDGFADFAVAAPGTDDLTMVRPSVSVFRGASPSPASTAWRTTTRAIGTGWGRRLAGAR